MNRSNNSGFLNRRHSNFCSKAPSAKKFRFTDRTAADNEKRYVISEACQAKMAILVSEMMKKPRKETSDWTLKENLIKKIDEKFGEQYNI